MSRWIKRILFCGLLIACFTATGFAKTDSLKGKALLAEPAGKAYLFGDYAETLRLLSEKKSLSDGERMLQAKAHYALGQYEETQKALQSLSEKGKKKSYSRYWLAGALYQLQDKNGAKELWSDLAREESVIGKLSADNLDALSQGTATLPLMEEKPEITEKVFLETSAARLYKNKQFSEALPEFEKLSQRYPKDPVVQRYIGMTQKKLGNTDAAITAYQKGLEKHPFNAALRMELAKAYKSKKAKDLSRQEFEFVRDYDDTGIYSVPAKKELEKKGKGKKKKKKSFLPERLKMKGATGIQFINNVPGAPDDPRLRKPGDRTGRKYRYNLGAVYQLLETKKWEVNLDGSLDHSYFDDGFNEKNSFIHGVGLSAAYKTKLFGKKLKLVLRQGETHTIKKRGWFSFGNVTSAVANYQISKRYEFDLYNRWGYTKFDTNGTRKDISGKDGFVEKVGFKQKYTPTKNEDFFFSFDVAYSRGKLIGKNGDFHAVEVIPGVKLPIVAKLIGAFSATYKHDYYPLFEFPETRRLRKGHTLGLDAGLERELNDTVSWFAEYAFDRALNNNGSFQKHNNTFGTGIKFKL